MRPLLRVSVVDVNECSDGENAVAEGSRPTRSKVVAMAETKKELGRFMVLIYCPFLVDLICGASGQLAIRA